MATVFYGFLILSIDTRYSDVIVTPMLALWWLMMLSFFMRPRGVATIAFILFVFVIVSLLGEGLATLVTRSVTFAISSILATLFASQRYRMTHTLEQMIHIIQSVPAAIIAANEQGTIIAASDQAKLLVGEKYQPLVGHAFSDVFMGNWKPADALRIYSDWFSRSEAFEEILLTRDHPATSFVGKLQFADAGLTQILVVVLTQTGRAECAPGQPEPAAAAGDALR